ncbi:MAG: cupin domain-containing protein [Xanthobacteraceae bacterium]|nr:cupin domain-containing protein [Xanthobacteraceae bacterium]QYK43824.1 MAG: cupin domain-containing protein [Xanthobacteraceae bacterium]
MKMRIAFAAFALAVAFGVTHSIAQQAPAPAGIAAKNVLRDDLKGLDGQETIMQFLEINPGAVVPWHTHPDGHEISYVVEGELTLQEEGKDSRKLKAGEGFHIQPGTPHSAVNSGSTNAKIVVVRVNAKGKPIAVPYTKK